MPLELYNTLSGKRETFDLPKDHTVTMYNCGPTVYNYAHIGNLRAYVFVDVLRRTLEYNDYKVKQVMNITDVGHLTSDADDGDDKMVKALKRLGKPMTLEAMREVADIYTEAFKKDLQALNILSPHEMPRASDHIKEDIELIRALEEKGVAYPLQDGLYFDTSKFPDYGRLGNIRLEGQQAGARVEVKRGKKNPRDFTLWKLSATELGWESPWGKGFPGWHIECSAMSRKYLGQPFDIHTGGIDHVPIHHNNEIAQSETAYGVPLATFWMHNEHLIVADSKMAKSGENFITLQVLTDRGIHPLAFRYYLLQTRYRSPLNFSWEALEASQTALVRMQSNLDKNFLRNTAEVYRDLQGGRVVNTSDKDDERFNERFESAVADDLNTPALLELLNEVVPASRFKNTSKRRELVEKINAVLGLDILNLENLRPQESIPDALMKLAHKREEARREKNFKLSDEIRKTIEKEGYEILDTVSGPVVRKKS